MIFSTEIEKKIQKICLEPQKETWMTKVILRKKKNKGIHSHLLILNYTT